MRALGEPGCHERKGLAWLGIPGGDYAAAVRFFGETLGLELAFDTGNTVELAARNGDRIQLFGSATATSSSTATTAPGSSRCWRWTTRIRRAPSWPAVALTCSAGGSQTVPGLGSPSGCPKQTSTGWAPAWRSWQVRRLWSNALDMRQKRTLLANATMYRHRAWLTTRATVGTAMRPMRPAAGHWISAPLLPLALASIPGRSPLVVVVCQVELHRR
jgi:hypothetical protein